MATLGWEAEVAAGRGLLTRGRGRGLERRGPRGHKPVRWTKGGGCRAVFGRKGRPLSWQEAALQKEGGDCSGCSRSWKPYVAEVLPPPIPRRRASEPSAWDFTDVLFACPTALLDKLLVSESSPPSLCASSHSEGRLLILLRHRVAAEATVSCPISAREHRDTGLWGGEQWIREPEDGGWWLPDRKIEWVLRFEVRETRKSDLGAGQGAGTPGWCVYKGAQKGK